MVRRTVATVLVVTVALILSAWVLPGFAIDTFGHALLAGAVVGLIDALVWPAFAFLLATLPDERRGPMNELREAIRSGAPEATEAIAYKMPAFRSHGQCRTAW